MNLQFVRLGVSLQVVAGSTGKDISPVERTPLMRARSKIRVAASATLGAAALSLSTLVAPVGTLASAGVAGAAAGAECIEAGHSDAASARGGHGADHRGISAEEQRAIAKRTRDLLAAKGGKAAAAATVPVYVHVMRARNGAGDVTDQQIAQQISVLNASFGGGEDGADTGFSFTLAGTFRYNNDQWHQDRQSKKYRSATRKGGANALNMWLVDFDYLGIATFPWDYSRQGSVDGIRVHWDSLPGGSIANYNLGETATHEAGHWFGLYHTFQGGCTATNDEVADTPAQAGPTSGCPEGQDTCPLPGTDPIHNYMDYSYDSCYTQFTAGQSARASQMWTAYRG
jgi:hypothetical protein